MPRLSFHSPIGPLTLLEDDGAIVALHWGWHGDHQPTSLLRRACRQLEAYFDGKLRSFDVPLRAQGSAYRRRVWTALLEIPYGATRSYSELALLAGGSARSIGQANGANPIPILIPCHRVVGRRDLGGYSGGEGIISKNYLLSLEADRLG